MTTIYKEHPTLKTVEIIVDGKVTADEFHSIMPQMEAFIEKHGKIKILEIVKNFGGMSLSVMLEGIKFDFKHIKDFSHCAVVTDEGWIGPFTRLFTPFFDVEVKTFKLSEEVNARKWLKDA